MPASLRQLLGKLGHLGRHLMEQSYDRRFALFKGRMDIFNWWACESSWEGS